MEGSPLMQQWRYMAQVDLDTAVSQVTASGARELNTPLESEASQVQTRL